MSAPSNVSRSLIPASDAGPPKLDLVICTYNRAADLELCLQAISEQNADPVLWRVTVVDNNCSDDTPDVVDRWVLSGKLPGLTRVLEPRQGLTPARQRGVQDSTADWVAFVDDDCLLAPGWVAAALRFGKDNPEIGAFGGRVEPDWGGPTPAHLAQNGWLFAQQELGEVEKEVESLVGAGVVLNRRVLNLIGWTDQPFLADRTAKGHLSGGDVEISMRLTANGYKLFYVPSLILSHRIAKDRQRLGKSLGLARGLGAGAELVDLMCAPDADEWARRSSVTLRRSILRHAAAIPSVLLRRYSGWDWLIHAAFLSGRHWQNRALRQNEAVRIRLASVCARKAMSDPRQSHLVT